MKTSFPENWVVKVPDDSQSVMLLRKYFAEKHGRTPEYYTHIRSNNWVYSSGEWDEGKYAHDTNYTYVTFEELKDFVFGNMKKVLGVVWFTNQFTVGVVLHFNGYEEKAYISRVKGENEESDIEFIKLWGASFPVEEARSLIKKLGTQYDGF